MVVASMDKATKKVHLSDQSLEGLAASDKKEAQDAVALVNRLMADLVVLNDEIPTAPTNVSQNFTTLVQSCLKNGGQALAKKNFTEALKFLNTGLEAALRRPLWESTAFTMTETAKLLSTRSDAHAGAKMWAEAYADASMSMILNPNDIANYARKGEALAKASRFNDAKVFLQQAVDMAPHVAAYGDKLAEVERACARETAGTVFSEK